MLAGRSSIYLAGGISLSWGIERRHLANNVAVFARFNNIARFIFTSIESLILGAINSLGFYIGYYLE